MSTDSFAVKRRLLLSACLVGLAAMLCAWFIGRIEQPDLVVHRGAGAEHAASANGMSGMPPGMGMGGNDPEIGSLMKEAAEKSNDAHAQMHVAQHLAQAERWDAAASFAERAQIIEPNNPEVLYLLSVIRHGQQRHADAAEGLERVVAMQDDAAVRYSLAILYIYYLNTPEKGKEHLLHAQAMPGVPEEVMKDIREELAKLPAEGKK